MSWIQLCWISGFEIMGAIRCLIPARSKGPMAENTSSPEPDVYGFILEHIDTVPQLEALVLLWSTRPRGWTCEELGARLYVAPEKVGDLLRDLVRKWLVSESAQAPKRYSYLPKSNEQDEMLGRVQEAYKHDLVRISTMIHAKASSAVREFARAFRFKKDSE